MPTLLAASTMNSWEVHLLQIMVKDNHESILEFTQIYSGYPWYFIIDSVNSCLADPMTK